MNVGTEFTVDLVTMMEPQIGNLVEAPVEGEPRPVLARIMSVSSEGAVLKAVPKTTNY